MRTTAIVTGASHGIGYELALNLSRRGIDVIAVARNHEALIKLQIQSPEQIHIVPADVSTDEGRSIISLKAKEFGKIDYLINNAAIIVPLKNLENVTSEELTTIFNTNVFSAILLSSQLLPLLAGGRVLNVSSAAEFLPTAGAGPYCISKAALKMATRLQQMEYKNVAVNSVIPGEVETNMQVELRNSDHPLKNLFKESAEKGALMPASTCAAFLAHLLLDVTTQDFINKEWQIYDTTHRNNWLKEGMLLPMPHVAKTLTGIQHSPCSSTPILNQSFMAKDLANRFDCWMKNYNHPNRTDLEHLLEWLNSDYSAGGEKVKNYNQYCELAKEVVALGYKEDTLISEIDFNKAIEQKSKQKKRFYLYQSHNFHRPKEIIAQDESTNDFKPNFGGK